ncbi:MAG: cysteine peptidase family C39 domain-containing protein [Thermoanaerobaculia bacterium]
MRTLISLQRTVVLCSVVLAACGNQSASGKLVLQLCPKTVNDGGAAAALSMVLAYHGHPVAQEVLQKELRLPDGTTDALKMIQSARTHGVIARGVKVPSKELLAQLPVGSIIHRNDRRFQVLEKIAGDRVTVLDPFDGRQTLPIDSFWANFSTVALLFE